MNRLATGGVRILMAVCSIGAHAQTVDVSSDAYKTGHLIGQIFVVVLVILIIRRLFFKK